MAKTDELPKLTAENLDEPGREYFSNLTVQWAQRAEVLYDQLRERNEDTFKERVDLIKLILPLCITATIKSKAVGATSKPKEPILDEKEMEGKTIEELKQLAGKDIEE